MPRGGWAWRAQDGEQPRKEISFVNVGFPHFQDEWYLSKMFPAATPLLDRGVNVPHPPISLFRVPGTSPTLTLANTLVIYPQAPRPRWCRVLFRRRRPSDVPGDSAPGFAP